MLNQAIEALRAYSLIRRDPQKRMLSIHRLVQAVLQDQQNEVERRLWIERAMQAINAVFPHASYKTWEQCERLIPLALSAAQRIEQEQCVSQVTGRLLFETATYLQDRGRYEEAEPLYQRALHIQEQVLGPEHFDVAYLLHNLAILYSKLGKYELSLSLYERARSMWERDPIFLEGYFKGGNNVQTKLLLPLVALRLREQKVRPEHSDVAYLLNGLASLYFEQGKYAQAEPLYQRALELWRQRLGWRHPLVATVVHNLANLYREQGKYEQAEPLYLKALHIREQRLGSEHPDTAEILYDFAVFQELQGNQQEGRSLYQRALAIHEKAFGSEHPKTRATRQRLMTLKQSVSSEAVAPPQDDTPLEQS